MRWILLIWALNAPITWHVFDTKAGCNDAVTAFELAYWKANKHVPATVLRPVVWCVNQSSAKAQEHSHDG